jgi:hypothetical protein
MKGNRKRRPISPEEASDLEHAVESTNDKLLEVELRSDAQEHVHLELVVMRHERLCCCTACDHVQDRCFYLHCVCVCVCVL